MSKQSHLGKSSELDNNHALDDAPSYAVGYGRPPRHTRWKPGQSGNPTGRRKGRRNGRTVVEEALNQRIRIRQGGRARSLTNFDAFVLTILGAAIQRDAKAWGPLLSLIRSAGILGEAPEATSQEPFTADDEALIAEYLLRHGNEIGGTEGTEQPEGDDEKTSRETTPPKKGTAS
jgi:uncharacterized protein DUF5681